MTARRVKIMRCGSSKKKKGEQLRSGVQGVQARFRREKRKTPSLHHGEKERGLVLGLAGSGELRDLLGGSKSLH